MTLVAPPRVEGRGRQSAAVEAARDAEIDRKVVQIEATAAWERVHRLGQITHYGATYDRPDLAQQAGAELQTLAARQLRMLRDGSDAA